MTLTTKVLNDHREIAAGLEDGLTHRDFWVWIAIYDESDPATELPLESFVLAVDAWLGNLNSAYQEPVKVEATTLEGDGWTLAVRAFPKNKKDATIVVGNPVPAFAGFGI